MLTGLHPFVSYFCIVAKIIRMKTKCLFIFLVISGISANVSAQQIYKTIQGDIAISVNVHDSIRLMVSHDLLVILDYETSKVSLRVGYETFRTQIDSLDNKLKAMAGSAFEFNGKLGITINSKNYNPQRYNMEGTLTSAVPPIMLKGNGSMTCMPAGDQVTPACLLLVSMESSLSVLQLSSIFPEAEDGVRIDVRQSTLKKEGD